MPDMSGFGFRIDHIGINETNDAAAHYAAQQLCALFDWTPKEGSSSVFAGPGVEVMKKPYLGRHGHIAVATSDIEGAISALQARGASFLNDTRKFGPDGYLQAVYIDMEVGGFAVHLVQRSPITQKD